MHKIALQLPKKHKKRPGDSPGRVKTEKISDYMNQ